LTEYIINKNKRGGRRRLEAASADTSGCGQNLFESTDPTIE